MCLYSWDYTINHHGNEEKNKKIGHTETTWIDLGPDMEKNIVNNIKCLK